MPERSFFLFGYQFPVCARCTGIMVGEVVAVPMSIIFEQNPAICALMILPMVLDGGIQYISKYTSTNVRRFLTGILSGYGSISLIVTAIKMLF